MPLATMSEKDRRKVIVDFCAGRIFTSQMITEEGEHWANMLRMIFIPIVLGGLADLSEEDTGDVGVFWEYADQAGPRSINGYPIFFSMHIMHITDWQKVAPKITEMLKTQKQFIERGDGDGEQGKLELGR